MYVLRRVAAMYLASCLLLGCNDTQETTKATTSSQAKTATLTTELGTLKIAMGENAIADSLFLNGELIFQRAREPLQFYGQKKREQDELVLVGSSCGVSCPTDQLAWIILRANAEPQIVEDRQFYAYPADIKLIDQAAGVISVDLGYSQKQRRYADLTGSTLKFRLEPVAASDQVLNEEACNWLHSEVLPACIDARKTEPDCISPHTEFPDFMDQRLNRVDDYPGFNGDRFEALCETACKTEEIPNYKAFASSVCGIN